MGFTHRSQEDCGRCQGWDDGRFGIYIPLASIHGTGIFLPMFTIKKNQANVR